MFRDDDQILTCWPNGYLTVAEAQALLSCVDHQQGERDLTTEEQMAKETLQAALNAPTP